VGRRGFATCPSIAEQCKLSNPRCLRQLDTVAAASKAAEEALRAALAERSAELDAKVHALGAALVTESNERKAGFDSVRAEQRTAADQLRHEVAAVRAELAAAEAFLTERSAREAEVSSSPSDYCRLT
jgi:hypothetical protein